MDEEPVEPEVVGREGPRFTFRSVGSPWALFGMLGALGALGALGVAAVLALSMGWFFLVALAYRWLWNYAFSSDVTQLVYGAQSLGYPKALASVALFLLAGWLMSPKKGS
ncbi:MAG: hypothetical protein HY928_00630 [Elusimicrobia bacterium]|nr:hypothetical protein [Elusimicrobiota bacterium]